MIRVGFVLTFDSKGWLGGISYFRNLLGALKSLANPRIEPIIFSGPSPDSTVLSQFPKFLNVPSPLLTTTGPSWMVRRVIAKISARDIWLESLLKKHDVRVLSHQGFLGTTGEIPVIGWIPDFQEHHFPEFFSKNELSARARKISMFSRICKQVILSSHDAKGDLEVVRPCCVSRAKVLQFVANVVLPPIEELEQVAHRLNIPRPYFHLPNQFWIHKNHGIVIEAVKVLKEQGVDIRVVATGNTHDPRQPGYFGSLLDRVKEAGLEEQFICVGTVSYTDLVSLMAGAVAIINPSRFEGWSTSVEEAKSLGKTIILSDLSVHREQAPERGQYFSPDDYESLAAHMLTALHSHNPTTERIYMDRAQERLPLRLQEFALSYEEIVLETVGSTSS